MAERSPIINILSPHPFGLILTTAFILTLQNSCEFPKVIALSFPYFILLNATFNLDKIGLKYPEVLTTSFLSSFAKNLRNSSPEGAFLSAFESNSSQGLLGFVMKIRDGEPLLHSLKRVKGLNRGEALLPTLLSDLLELDSEEASNRIAAYVMYREEKERLKSSLSIKMAVISLRFRVLCVICSSSLAVISFTSPLLYSLRGLNWGFVQAEVNTLFSFDPNLFMVCISTAVVSTYAYSKLLPGVDGFKLSILSALVFLATELALVLAIGWHI